MDRETQIECLQYNLKQLIDSRGSDFSGVQALEMAIKNIETLSRYEKTIRILSAALAETIKFYGGAE